MRDKRRFTGLAALGNRGEEGRIGFYQKPLTGQARRRILKVARVLERHDPRYGDKKTERSEEHTSELQSLMRISYAVFCLKKKNQTTTPQCQTRNDTKNSNNK